MATRPIDCGCNEFRWRRMLNRRRMLQAGAASAAGLVLPLGRLRVLAQEATPGAAPSGEGHAPVRGPERAGPGPIVNGSYISPLVELYGDVEVGERCFVASNTILFASDGQLVSLGDENNCQDNAYLLAQEAGLRFGDMVSIAHQAIIENSTIGDFTFFGFRSRTRNCEVGEGSMIMHNTTVENVTIPPNRITPPGVRITMQEEADALPVR